MVPPRLSRVLAPSLTLAAFLGATACGDDSPATDASVIDASGDDDDDDDDDDIVDARVVDAPIPPDAVQPTCDPVNGTTLASEVVASGLDSPVLVTSAPGDGRLFVIEQPGRIRIIKAGELLDTPFLDLSDDDADPVRATGNEQGLLGLAFHPNYAINGRFFVYYTAKTPSNALVTAEYHVSDNPDVADETEERLLVMPHPNTNHNGGSIAFDPNDGYLYIGTGDGGSAHDPPENAENNSRLLGKMLRIDIDDQGTKERPYGIPASNPYADSPNGPDDPRPEIWAKGLRNPYRWTFDTNGDLYIGDVGQNTVEEIDVQPASSQGGEDYGWDIWEGDFCHEPPDDLDECPTEGYVEPVVTLLQDDGYASVIGGAVYRGVCFPDIVGWFFYSDFFMAALRTFEWDGDSAVNDRQLDGVSIGNQITSIHTDALGEVYITNRNGTVRHLIVEG